MLRALGFDSTQNAIASVGHQSVFRSEPIDDDDRLRDVERLVENEQAASASRAAGAAAAENPVVSAITSNGPIFAAARRDRDVGRNKARVRARDR